MFTGLEMRQNLNKKIDAHKIRKKHAWNKVIYYTRQRKERKKEKKPPLWIWEPHGTRMRTILIGSNSNHLKK